MSGAHSRTKGQSFERWVAQQYRLKWPDKIVRRSQQSHKAFEPDVVVEGVPLWTECQIAARPNPLMKLDQAEEDCFACYSPMHPIVVWRKTSGRTTWVTMRFGTLVSLCLGDDQYPQVANSHWNHVVTLDFADWLEHLQMEPP